MDKEEFLKKFDHVFENSLLTEDGFINPVLMNELTAWLKKSPKTYERLSEDPEWNTPRCTNVKEITGSFALWAVRQGENKECFPHFVEIINYLSACLRLEFIKKKNDQWSHEGWGDFSLCEINKLLFDILWDMPIFMEWNEEKIVGKGWLDLEALFHNVCVTIRDERRKNDEFDRKFEEEHGKLTLDDF